MTRRRERSQAQLEDVSERRKVQNRIAQRHYRERQKQCLENAHKLLLAHEAMQKRCHVAGQSSYGGSSWLGAPSDASSGMNAEHGLESVQAETQRTLMRLHGSGSGSDASMTYRGNLGDLGLGVAGVDMPGQPHANTLPESRNDTIEVRVNEPRGGRESQLQLEDTEPFNPVSPSDFFQFSPSSGSDKFDPMLGFNTESPGLPSTYQSISTPSTSQWATPPAGLRESRRQSNHASPEALDKTDVPGPAAEGDATSMPGSRLERRPSKAGDHAEPAAAGRRPPQVDDDEWSTPLLAAAGRGHVQIVKLLVKSGADLESKSKSGKSCLFWAVEMRQMDTVRCCLDLGADLGAVRDESGLGLFHRAVLDDDVPLLEVLLECCARLGERGREWVHMTDRHNRTPLYLAAEMGKAEIAELFVKAGADVNRR
ncbi:hypothetical protein QIS74_06989 [Colletotrichum tabaci]|uniref:BZIP domain-containing protein n=1 Tax=Colletotrichum tabaci TaxID=1209068 RepID=A0AAV9T9Y0_9PEZI